MSGKRKPARTKLPTRLANQADMGYNKLLHRLDRIAGGVEGISTAMNKPENKFKKIMEIIGYVAAVIGVVEAADKIRGWIIGG